MKSKKTFNNYENGSSPRNKRKHKNFTSETFLSVQRQVEKFTNDDEEFMS